MATEKLLTISSTEAEDALLKAHSLTDDTSGYEVLFDTSLLTSDMTITWPNFDFSISDYFDSSGNISTFQYGTTGVVNSGLWLGNPGSGSTSAVWFKLVGSATAQIQARLGLEIKSDTGLKLSDRAGTKSVLFDVNSITSGNTRTITLPDKDLDFTDKKNGFIDYNDTTGSNSITADTWTTIPNNGLGSFSNNTYSPSGVTDLMDVSNGSIDVSELVLGDSILVRNDFTVNPNTNNALLEFRYMLGSGANQYTLSTTVGRLDDGSGKDYRFSLTPDLIYMGDNNTKDNPIFIQIRLSSNGTFNNAGSVIQTIKRDINIT